MFNSGIKSNQRCNGVKLTPSNDQICNSKSVSHLNYNSKSKLVNKDPYNNDSRRDRKHVTSSFYHINSSSEVKVKLEPEDLDFNNKLTAHSIIDIDDANIKQESDVIPTVTKPRLRRTNLKATHHEARQRIDYKADFFNHYQHHWFSASLEKFKLEDKSREERIEITRHEFRRHIQQIVRSNVGQPNRFQELYDKYLKDLFPVYRCKVQPSYSKLVSPRICEMEKCMRPALPCTKFCTLHIMLNKDQVLFEYCTAKFADNTQCSTPVFDISHELPLCAEHARKRDNYKLYQEAKPKKLRKKVKPSAMIRPQKRSKKKRKFVHRMPENGSSSGAILDISIKNSPTSEEACETIEEESPELEVEDLHQVLALNENGLEQALVTQAHLLEETDISTVLSTIQVDEFSDFFTGNLWLKYWHESNSPCILDCPDF